MNTSLTEIHLAPWLVVFSTPESRKPGIEKFAPGSNRGALLGVEQGDVTVGGDQLRSGVDKLSTSGES